MWFAALSPAYAEPWLLPLLQRLLQSDAPTLRLLRSNPFPDVAAALRPRPALPLPLHHLAERRRDPGVGGIARW